MEIYLSLTFLNYIYSILFFFWPHRTACGILVPQPGIKPMPPALEVWSLNHWTNLFLNKMCETHRPKWEGNC